jgi:hypothetical protein
MVPFSILLFRPSLSPRNREVMLGHSLMYFVKFSDALREKWRRRVKRLKRQTADYPLLREQLQRTRPAC